MVLSEFEKQVRKYVKKQTGLDHYQIIQIMENNPKIAKGKLSNEEFKKASFAIKIKNTYKHYYKKLKRIEDVKTDLLKNIKERKQKINTDKDQRRTMMQIYEFGDKPELALDDTKRDVINIIWNKILKNFFPKLGNRIIIDLSFIITVNYRINVEGEEILISNTSTVKNMFNAIIISSKDKGLFEKDIRENWDDYLKELGETDTWAELLAVKVFGVQEIKHGGCSNKSGGLHNQRGHLITSCPKTKNNNCLIDCIRSAIVKYNIKVDKKFLTKTKKIVTANIIRKTLDIPSGTFLSYEEDLQRISKLLKINTKVYSQDDKLLIKHKCACRSNLLGKGSPKSTTPRSDKNKSSPYIELCLVINHYMLIEGRNDLHKCNKCGRSYYNSHKCNPKRASYYKSQICNAVTNCMKFHEEELNINTKMIIYDLETFEPEMGESSPTAHDGYHVIYAIGWIYNNIYHFEYSEGNPEEIIKKFMDFVLSCPKDTYLVAHNNAGFDSHFIVDYCYNNEIRIDDMIMSNGRILTGLIGNKIKLWDSYQFITSSLDRACKDFGVSDKNAKSSFDHTKMKTYEDIKKHKKECLEYLRRDVMGLHELIYKFSSTMNTLLNEGGEDSPCPCNKNVWITDFVTISHMSYAYWSFMIENGESSPCPLRDLSNINTHINLPDQEQYEFISKSIYGGRCYPSQRLYKSEEFDEIMELDDKLKKACRSLTTEKGCGENSPADSKEESDKYRKQLIEIHKNLKDYVFDADVKSLYPYVMKVNKYPVGFSHWIEGSSHNSLQKEFTNTEEFKEYMKYIGAEMGIFEIEFYPPKNIKTPVLPRHGENKGLIWSVEDGQGIYTSIDIEDCLRFGYRIKLINKGLIWSKSFPVFEEYINKMYGLKAKQDELRDAGNPFNKSLRTCVKLFMNALYGKQLQHQFLQDKEIVNTVEKIWKFVETHENNTIVPLESGAVILYGHLIDEHRESRITKPRHLGAFILAYSRRRMLDVFSAISPDLTQQDGTYRDTDSDFIKSKDLPKIKHLIGNKLGDLANDLDNDAKIIKQLNLAPKCYSGISLDCFGNVNNSALKNKGIPKQFLKYEMFEDVIELEHGKYQGKEIEMKGRLKRMGLNLRDADSSFKIKNTDMTRTFCKTAWNKMDFVNNEWVPFGYERVSARRNSCRGIFPAPLGLSN